MPIYRKLFPVVYWMIACWIPAKGLAQTVKGVSIIENKTTGMLEIRNGLAGIVIPGEKAFTNKQFTLAPLQSFIYADGTYSDNTVNYLTTATAPASVKVHVLTRSDAEVIVRMEYRFQKKMFEFGKSRYKGGEAGPGFYYCLVQLRKGEKTIVIEEDTNYDITYAVKISNGLMPDKARYRGWESYSVQYGYEPGGGIYRPEEGRWYPLDATVDLDYNKPLLYPKLVLWEPAGGEVNSGRYWQVFNSKAGDNSNLFGFFQGKPSRLLAAKYVGPALRVIPEDAVNKERSTAEILVDIQRRSPDDDFLGRKRFQWVAFISTKKDVRSPEQPQPIGRELNRVAGLGAVITDYMTKPAVLIPAFYKGAIFTSAEKMADLCKKIKTDAALYQSLYNIDGNYKPVWDAWRFPDSARSLIKQLVQLREDLINQYQNGEGTYTNRFRYWKGGLNYKFYAIAVSCLFADKSIAITATDKQKLEQLVAGMARIVWDNNNVPLFDSAGVNFGPANMSFQYRNNARIFFALLLANDPSFTARAKSAVASVNNDLNQVIYPNGSTFGTPHYTQAAIDPVLFSVLQLKQAGLADLFRNNERLARFARFYTSLVTPPSVRFLNKRKLVAFGDGAEENAATFALLAEGLRETNAALSEELSYLYRQGTPIQSLSGPVTLAANMVQLPAKKFTATTSCYDGYATHFRSALNTPDESALWVLNGNGLYDHRNDDAGQVSVYALQAPLSVSSSSFYYPNASDGRMKSMVMPERTFPQWKEAEQPINERSLTNRTWPVSTLLQFASLGYSASTTIKMKAEGREWYRKISMLSYFSDSPIFIFYDSLPGNESNIWSLPLMTEGTVYTPAGSVTPVRKIYDYNGKKELPQATTEQRIGPGINRFIFTGQQWPMHPTRGIDCRLYTFSESPLSFSMSEWGTVWQNSQEQQDFFYSNNKTYQETQQIIRLKSLQPFYAVLLPYRKGSNPYAESVKQAGGKRMLISRQQDDVIVAPGYYGIKTGKKIIAGILSENGRFNEWGLSITGGYSEVEDDGDVVAVRVHGNSGVREIKTSYEVTPQQNYTGITVGKAGTTSVITIPYQSKSNELSNGSKGYTEYVFKRK
jgi:hypothetical protein